MLDLLGIVVSGVMMLLVIARAAKMDSINPWFEMPPDPNAPLTGLAKARANAEHRIPTWRKRRS